MNYGSSPSASMPMAAGKGLAMPLPSSSVTPPASRTFIVSPPPAPAEVKK